jgi:hypothetical protein
LRGDESLRDKNCSYDRIICSELLESPEDDSGLSNAPPLFFDGCFLFIRRPS